MEGDNMANPGHLAILKQGVVTWNGWRKQNPEIQPDLSRADLDGAHLIEADLRGVDLRETYLNEAYLIEAHLNEANLRGAQLIEAYLRWAYFRGADLRGAHLRGADLRRADLRGAHLDGANFNEANLSVADLRGAYLHGGDLHGADLRGTHLDEADLQRANLRYAQLSRCDLTRAKLSGAKLYATARDDWIVDGVECSHVFWDAAGRIRSPKNRDLAPGEFEQLYRAVPTIEYVFQNGMTPLDPLIMDHVIRAIQHQNPEYDIKIESISARGLAPSIKFTVEQKQYVEAALAAVSQMYEAKLQEFAGRLDEVKGFIQLIIDRPNSVHI